MMNKQTMQILQKQSEQPPLLSNPIGQVILNLSNSIKIKKLSLKQMHDIIVNKACHRLKAFSCSFYL